MQLALVALHEYEGAFEYRHLGDDSSAAPQLKALWPLNRFSLRLRRPKCAAWIAASITR